MVSFELGALKLTLRNPNLGDSLLPDLNLTLKRTLTGIAYTYIKTDITYKLVLNFTGIDASDRNLAIDFFKQTAGQTITYTDYDSNIWNGKIITDILSIVNVSRYSSQFEIIFEGKRA